MGLGGRLDNPAVNSMERTPLIVAEKVGLAPRPIWVGMARSDTPTALYRHLQSHKGTVHRTTGNDDPQVEKGQAVLFL